MVDFTQLLSRETLEGLSGSFRASAIFGFKKLLISGIKKHNPDGPGSISYVSESSEQASESKFDFTLQKKNKNKKQTNKRLLKLSGV